MKKSSDIIETLKKRKEILTTYLQQRLLELKKIDDERKRIIIEIFEINSRVNELNELIKMIEENK